MFRWFSAPKKKEEDNEFVLLDIISDASTDVISDNISVMTSSVSIEPDFVCKYYTAQELYDQQPSEDPYTNSIEEVVVETEVEAVVETEAVVEVKANAENEYNYTDVEDITEEINTMNLKPNVFSTMPQFEIVNEDFIESSVRKMVELMFTVDNMAQQIVASTFLL